MRLCTRKRDGSSVPAVEVNGHVGPISLRDIRLTDPEVNEVDLGVESGVLREKDVLRFEVSV